MVRQGGWRDLAGEEGCKGDEAYEEIGRSPMELFEKDSFCAFTSILKFSPPAMLDVALNLDAASTQDFILSDSCYGRHLPSLIRIIKGIVGDMLRSGEEIEVSKVKGNPANNNDFGVYKSILRGEKPTEQELREADLID